MTHRSNLTPQQRLCHICTCERHELETQGYIPNGRAKNLNMRIWYYVLPAKNKTAAIVLDLDAMYLAVFINAHKVKEYR